MIAGFAILAALFMVLFLGLRLIALLPEGLSDPVEGADQ